MARRTKRKIARSRLPLQRQLGLEIEGRYFDLRGLFNKLNARHFGNRLRGYKVVWGRKRRERPKEYFIFGTIQEEDRVIRINPWLDQRFVPLWFLEYILYHEMLHAVVATFFLIRYQSVVARRSEMIFACQFFRISFFIIRALQQNLADAFAKCFRSEITLDPPAMTN